MKTENLSIGLRVLYHAIEWLTVFLILLIFAVQTHFCSSCNGCRTAPVCLPWA